MHQSDSQSPILQAESMDDSTGHVADTSNDSGYIEIQPKKKEKKNKRSSKGKARAVELSEDSQQLGHSAESSFSNRSTPAIDQDVFEHEQTKRLIASPTTNMADADQDVHNPSESYPPMNEEDVEAKKIEEHLRHWELMEKQRRKAARESRAARQPSSVIGDVARRASGLFNIGAPNVQHPNAPQRKSSLRDGKTDGAGRGKKDDEYVELGSRVSLDGIEEAKSERSPSPHSTTFPEKKSKRHSTSSINSIATTRSGPNNPFSNPPNVDDTGRPSSKPDTPQDEPFTPPVVVTATTSPPKVSRHSEPATSASQSFLQVPPRMNKRPKKSGTVPQPKRPMSIPKPEPLDLPEAQFPSVEPTSDMGHWRRVQEHERLQQDLEEEMERDARDGRWWTDWLCGCRESTGRRDDQAARTNPFE